MNDVKVIDLSKVMDCLEQLILDGEVTDRTEAGVYAAIQEAVKRTHPGVGEVPLVIAQSIALTLMRTMVNVGDFSVSVSHYSDDSISMMDNEVPPGVTFQ